jgi:hypothetical protein
VLFAGPSLSKRARVLARTAVELRRPIRRGDIAELIRRCKPGTVIIADGVFHDTLAVGHAEIREALDRGWAVWGLSSMGAIRAREMAPLGMRGFGRVFDRFCKDDDFQDDEVALLHEPRAPYRAVSEPLVHLRELIEHVIAAKIVEETRAREVLSDLKSRWYGERTLKGTLRALGVAPDSVGDVNRFRIKSIDLEDFLTEGPDFVTTGTRRERHGREEDR